MAKKGCNMRTVWIISAVIIFGLLIWANMALKIWADTEHQNLMDANYLISNYSGRALLTQQQYTEFKQYLLNPEVDINKLEVYGSDDILIIYDITAPETHKSQILNEPASQRWKYERGRGMDYGGLAAVAVISLLSGIYIISLLHKALNLET